MKVQRDRCSNNSYYLRITLRRLLDIYCVKTITKLERKQIISCRIACFNYILKTIDIQISQKKNMN